MKQSEHNAICRSALMRYLRTALDEKYELGAINTCGYSPADIIEAITALNKSDAFLESNPEFDTEV